MQSTVDELHEKTRWFWRISSAFNGRSLESIQTIEALDKCTDMMYETNPARPLVHKVKKLRAEIISGESIVPQVQQPKVLLLPICV